MADTLPINFSLPGEEAIASYDYYDIASGTGYIEFYIGKTNQDSILSNVTFYSVPVSTSGTFDVPIDEDFDILINRPTTFKGTAIFNFPFNVSDASGVGGLQGYITVKIRKWDGSSETEIVSGNSHTITNVGFNTHEMAAVSLVIPETTFKKGEYLRISLGSSVTNSGANEGIEVYHDPDNLNSLTGPDMPSTFKAQLPVKINL